MITDEQIDAMGRAYYESTQGQEIAYSTLRAMAEAYEQSKWCDDMSKAPRDRRFVLECVYNGVPYIEPDCRFIDGFLCTYQLDNSGGYGEMEYLPLDGGIEVISWRNFYKPRTPPKE